MVIVIIVIVIVIINHRKRRHPFMYLWCYHISAQMVVFRGFYLQIQWTILQLCAYLPVF